MPFKIELEDGKIVEFENKPTPADVDFAINSITSKKSAVSEPRTFGQTIHSELISPILSGGSTFAAGIPKMVAAAQGPGMKEATFPEQQTIPGKILRGASEAVGFTAGLPGRAAMATGSVVGKIAPKLLGKGLGKVATGAATGAVGLAAAGDTLENRKEMAKIGGLIGGTIPIAAAGSKAIKGVVTKTGRWMAKNIGGVTDATVGTIKRLGADRVFEPLKSSADYVSQVLAPRLTEKIKQSVQKFTPAVQKFASEKLKIPQSAVETIKKKGVNNVSAIRQKYNDSTDLISQKITTGFQKMEQQADDAYIKAVDSFKGGQINSQKFFNSVQKALRTKGWIDAQGNTTNRYKGGLDPITDKMTDLYLDMRNVTTKAGKKIVGQMMSKEDFFTYRDTLSAMLRDKPSDRLIMQARNALYDSAEKSGMIGIKNARNLEAKAYSMKDRFLDKTGNIKALGKEQSLDRYHKLSLEQKRLLREIESYTGEKFVDDLEVLSASRYLDKIEQVKPEKVISDLLKSKNPEYTKFIKNQYDDLLGKDAFKDIYDDLMAHFANIDFELVSGTPGAGGGFYPSRSGLIRKGVAGASKQYYKNIEPNISKFGKSIVSGGKSILGALQK